MTPKIELYISNVIYSGWKDVKITRSIETMAGAFSLEVTEKVNNEPSSIKAGQSCYLEINGQRIITGYIDDVIIDIQSDTQTITISGRDKTSDLIDCSAIHQSGQWQSVPLSKIAADLCQPFDIKVIWSVKDADAEQVFTWWQIEPSETVFDNLARAARQRGVIMTSDVYGNLVFCSAGTTNLTTLTLGKNILSINLTSSYINRFSLYRVLGDNAAGHVWGINQTAEQSTAVVAEVNDTQVTRYRPSVILSDDNLIASTGKVRADWERRRNAAHSQPVTVTVANWFYDGVTIWQPNALITLNAKEYQNTELLITAVDFSLNNTDGLTTTLYLMARSGFLAPKEIETNIYLWRDYDY